MKKPDGEIDMKSPHNPYEVNPRKALSNKRRVELLVANNGLCCICGGKITVATAWDDFDLSAVPFVDEHINPLWLSGSNDFNNRGPAHVKCARDKTAKEATDRAKVRRMAERHLGAKRPKGPPMPGSKRSKWKKHLDGSVSRRER